MMMDLSPLPDSDFSVDDGVEAEVVQPVLADPVVVSAPQQHQEEGQAAEEPRVACHPNVFLVVRRERVQGVPEARLEENHVPGALGRRHLGQDGPKVLARLVRQRAREEGRPRRGNLEVPFKAPARMAQIHAEEVAQDGRVRRKVVLVPFFPPHVRLSSVPPEPVHAAAVGNLLDSRGEVGFGEWGQELLGPRALALQQQQDAQPVLDGLHELLPLGLVVLRLLLPEATQAPERRSEG
mmetsp:Transcript_5407/g.13536  ORF Transcript_5407/g.13536 Transcript_5407/m.13536 type:complete len:238 (+) Transcript_5407:61-774(+)